MGENEAIDRVLAGDKEAFGVIVEAYGARVLSYCRSRARSEEDARDTAQEVFLRAFRSLGSFRRGQSFAAWLFAIAANRLRTRIKLFSSEKKLIEAAAAEAATARISDPALEAEKSLARKELRDAVEGLPADMRSAIELYYFGELSVAETAKVLGIGEEAVKSRLFRARGALRRTLEKQQPDGRSRGNQS